MFRCATGLIGAAVAALGLFRLVGWQGQHGDAFPANVTFTAYPYDTGICFLFSGLGLLLAGRGKAYPKLCSLPVLVVGLLTLASYLLATNVGIDRLGAVPIGRMTPNSSLCFVLAGLLLQSMRTPSWVLSGAVGLLVLAATGYVGHSMKLDYAIAGGENPVDMAPATSAGVVLLSAGYFCWSYAPLTEMLKTKVRFWQLVPAIVVTWTLLATVLLTFNSLDLIRKQNETQFRALVAESAQAIVQEFNRYVQSLRGAVGLLNASRYVTRKEWQAYVDALDIVTNLQGASGIGYIERVQDDALPGFIQKTRKDGAPNFAVHPETAYREKFVIKYIEPQGPNRKAVGLDIGFESRRRVAAKQARDTGRATLTSSIPLVQDEKEQVGFLLLLPVYDTGAVPATRAAREAHLTGWVYAPLIARNFLRGVSIISGGQLDFAIFEGIVADPHHLIYRSDAGEAGNILVRRQMVSPVDDGSLWTVTWKASSKYVPLASSFRPLIIFIVGSIFSIVLGGLLHLLSQLYGGAVQGHVDNEERLSLAMEGAGQTLWDWDLITGKVSFSDSWALMMGYRSGDPQLDAPAWLLLVHPDDQEQMRVDFREFITGQRSALRSEFRMRHGNGEWRWILARGKVFERDDLGSAKRAVGTNTDISLRKAMQLELSAAKVAAERAASAKSDFLTNMSHEIRTPMNGILGTADLMRQTNLDDRQRKYLGVIRSSASVLLQILNEILDFSKIESGKFEINPAPMNVSQATEELIGLLQPIAQEKGLTLRYHRDPDIPEYIIGDEVRIRQVLTNLIGNAIKFTVSGTVGLRIMRTDADDQIAFVVSDTGIGIPEDKLDRIFETFTQIFTRGARKAQGTGLELAICKHLIEMMGGKITVESTPGAGSTFYASIRYAVPSADEIETLEQEHEIHPDEAFHIAARILVVEDVATNQFVISDILEALGCTVEIAENGAEAVSMVAERPYDLVFMDCQLPVMDGFEATREIREAGARSLPIVALTANALKGDKEKCLEAGMDGFVAKPIVRNDIVQALKRWIPEEEGHAA